MTGTKQLSKSKPAPIYRVSCHSYNYRLGIEWDGRPYSADALGDESKSIFWGGEVTIPRGRFPVPPDGRPDPAAPLYTGDGVDNKGHPWSPWAGTGFAEGYKPPPLILDRKLGRPPGDVVPWVRGAWLLSGPARQALAEIDPQAFDFVEVETFVRDRQGLHPTEPMWFADVVRVIDALDPEQPGYKRLSRDDGYTSAEPPSFFGKENIFMRIRIGDAHIFRLLYYKIFILCDDATRRQLRALKLRGFTFSEKGIIL